MEDDFFEKVTFFILEMFILCPSSVFVNLGKLFIVHKICIVQGTNFIWFRFIS